MNLAPNVSKEAEARSGHVTEAALAIHGDLVSMSSYQRGSSMNLWTTILITGDFSMTGVEVGFFKLVRKVVIYAIKRQPSQPDVRMGRIKIKITPGISKFPLKSQPVENAGEVNFVRVKIIGNRVGKGSKSTTGEKSHPHWECSEKSV